MEVHPVLRFKVSIFCYILFLCIYSHIMDFKPLKLQILSYSLVSQLLFRISTSSKTNTRPITLFCNKTYSNFLNCPKRKSSVFWEQNLICSSWFSSRKFLPTSYNTNVLEANLTVIINCALRIMFHSVFWTPVNYI